MYPSGNCVSRIFLKRWRRKMTLEKNTIYHRDNLSVLKEIPDESVDLIYIDPPFNTGKKQTRTRIKTEQSPDGDRNGFGGNRYKTTVIGTQSYEDKFNEYIDGFLKPRLKEAHRILKIDGTLYFHIDYREVYRCRILLDKIFEIQAGKGGFLNEIIWAYDYGGRSRKKWPAKHDNILVYTKDQHDYYFDEKYVNEIQYRAPSLNGLEMISPTDTWWHTIVPTNGSERTGYPTQKPLGILDRIVLASSKEEDLVIDFFAGSGTIGESCLRFNRRFIMVDNNPEAYKVMEDRFWGEKSIRWI